MGIFNKLKELHKSKEKQKNQEQAELLSQRELNESLIMEQEILLGSGDCEAILNFAKEHAGWEGLELDNLQKALSVNPNAEVIYRFAKEIKGCDIIQLQKYLYKDKSVAKKVSEDKKDVKVMDYTNASVIGLEYIKNIPGADPILADKEFYNIVKNSDNPSADLVDLMIDYCNVENIEYSKYTDHLVNIAKNRKVDMFPLVQKFAIEAKGADAGKVFKAFVDLRESKYLSAISDARPDYKDDIQKALRDNLRSM